MASLTPAEQQFFATGDASVLQPEPNKTQEPAAPSPLDTAGLGSPAPAAKPAEKVETRPNDQKPEERTSSAPTQLPDVAEILRRNLAEAQQRVAQLEQEQRLLQQKPPAQEKEPDPAEDPYGSLMFRLGKMQEQLVVLTKQQQEYTQQSGQAQQFQAFQQQVLSMRNDFAKTHPDFQQAYEHLRSVRAADLQLLGYTPQQIGEAIFREEYSLATSAVQQARNPAEVIYEMSKRHGYVEKPPTVQNPAEQATAIERAQAAAKTLSTQPNADQDLTVEGLKSASEADLNKLILDPKAWARMTGADQYPL